MKKKKKHEVFEVYICRYNGEIVYVGEGKRGRHKHCNSGTSHVYELNKLHFEGVVFDVDVKITNSKEIAVKMEGDLINTHQPKFNKDGIVRGKFVSAKMRSDFKKSFTNLVANSNITQPRKDRLYEVLDEYMTYHINKDVETFKLKLAKPQQYKNAKLMKMHSCVSALMYKKEAKGSTPDLLRTFLEQAYAEVYGDDTAKVTFDHKLWLEQDTHEVVKQPPEQTK